MKKTKILLQFILVAAIFIALNKVAFADGYGPYGPHIPEDTGLAGSDLLSVIGLGLYGIGSIIISFSAKLKGLLIK